MAEPPFKYASEDERIAAENAKFPPAMTEPQTLREAASEYMRHVQLHACDHDPHGAGTHTSCEPALILNEALAAARVATPLDVEFWWARRWAAQYRSDGEGRVAAAEMTRRANELGRGHPEMIEAEPLTHHPHDRAGEPNEGFPVCSVCGAIQTARAATPLDESWVAAIHAHMLDFIEQPESFDTFEAVGINIARHRTAIEEVRRG